MVRYERELTDAERTVLSYITELGSPYAYETLSVNPDHTELAMTRSEFDEAYESLQEQGLVTQFYPEEAGTLDQVHTYLSQNNMLEGGRIPSDDAAVARYTEELKGFDADSFAALHDKQALDQEGGQSRITGLGFKLLERYGSGDDLYALDWLTPLGAARGDQSDM